MSSIPMPSAAPDKWQEVLAKDQERMQQVEVAVEAALAVIRQYATTPTEIEYMRYKAGAKLLLGPLEAIDQALLVEQLSPDIVA